MADTILVNYRRGDSIGIPGRLHDRLARTFGQKNLFMDDSILNSQVAVCGVVLVVIGPNWLDAKDETGKRLLDNLDDSVVIEITAALSRDIRVIPVLVDGTQMPKANELPDPIKPLVRRTAVEMRNDQFDRDAEALIEEIRKAFNDGSVVSRSWRGKVLVGAAAAAVLLLTGWGGYTFLRHIAEQGVQRAELGRQLKWEEERKAVEAEANRKLEQQEQAEQQRLTALKAEQERETRAAAEAEAMRKAYFDAIREGNVAYSAGGFDKAIANFSEAIRLRPDDAPAFNSRGSAYESKGDDDRAIVDYNEAIRLNPNYAFAFNNRGLAYAHKGNQFRAIADYNEAIRLNPNYALAFCNRGLARQKINNVSDNDDKARARQLDASACR